MRFAALFVMAGLLAVAQKNRPEEMKQLQEAADQKDAAKRSAAIEEFLKKHPDSTVNDLALRELLDAKYEQSAKIARSWLKANSKNLKPAERAELFNSYARKLLKDKKDLKVAEKFAGRASQETREKEAREAQTTLGLVYAARKKYSKATPLLEPALIQDPASADVAQALGAASEQRHDSAKALQYYTQAVLARPNDDRRKLFADAYARVKGTDAGQEQFLDSEYHRLFPLNVAVTPYKPTSKRSSRVVLAEVYTGAGCPPCVGADLAFEAVLERYARQDVAVVMYHEHIPRPDPLTNADTVGRWKWLAGRGVPTYAVDGVSIQRGGGPRSYAGEIEKLVREAIDKQLETGADAALKLASTYDGQTVHVDTAVSGVTTKNIALHVLLVEKRVRYSGENGIRFHPMVVRSIASFDLSSDSLQRNVEFSQRAVEAALKQHLDDFEKHDDRHNKDGKFRFRERHDTVDWTQVAVVAFLQDKESKKILQAAWSDSAAKGREVTRAE